MTQICNIKSYIPQLLKMQQNLFKEIQVEGQSQAQGKPFPKCYHPSIPTNYVKLQEYFAEQAPAILKDLHEEGALFFRGCDIKSAEQFSSVLNKLGLDSFEYFGGAAVRKLIVGSNDRKTTSVDIFTTNQAPAEEPIPFHNQLLQNQSYPEYVSFFCYRQADSGGSTPLVSSVQLYQFVNKHHQEFLTQLEEKGVIYSRTVGKEDNPKSPIGRGWANIFKVQHKQEAEKKIIESGHTFEWINNAAEDCKLISKKLPATTTSKSGRKVFCNQMIAVFKGWIDDKNSPQQCLKFGDGTPVPGDIMQSIAAHAQKIGSRIEWKVGDFVLIDNQMSKHAREPFGGLTRKIYACLMKGPKEVRKGIHNVLHSGDEMPIIGLGTWKIPKEVCEEIVYEAIKAGYRMIDTAAIYANQVQVGRGINKALSEHIVQRNELFVTSKLWCTHMKQQHVGQAFERSRKDLNLEYLDLYLIHWPISVKHVPHDVVYPAGLSYVPEPKEGPKILLEKVPIMETWRALEQLVRDHKVRNIGVSNFNVSILRDLINSCTIKPAVNQIEIHPYHSQKKMIRYCRQNGICVTSYSTMGGASYVEIKMSDANDFIVDTQPVKKLVEKHQKSGPQVLFRWAIQQGLCVIPKTSKVARLAENFAYEWQLSPEDMATIDGLNKNKRYCDPASFTQNTIMNFY